MSEFKQKYPKLILRFRKETPRSPPFMNNKFTRTFINWLKHEKNIKITYKGNEIKIDPLICKICGREFDSKRSLAPHGKCHNEIKIDPNNHTTKFFLNFLREHAYLSKRILVGMYMDKTNASNDDYGEIKREFAKIIRKYVKLGKIEKYSAYNYKINKDMVK